MDAHLVSAAAGLIGALIGARAASAGQKRARRNARRADQLNFFYAPLFGIRAEILARSLVRLRVSGATSKAWNDLLERASESDREIRGEDDVRFSAVIDYENRQHAEVLMPLYRRMVKHFAENIGYSEASTLKHFPSLVEFVELWERW